ncbi:Acyl-coenzyme A thioesterase 13 [Lasiodiplodia hormozganensis]|uniref:Acyl-coenzyme A thioesterase 13 n=1 Tax=Lasiodiplodia hormozganensis TaxID=869390 RepID=A0AA40D6S1_9PEZI|nr:Acyl-coenzyme A thioesterase 13 [Lasiodiplodia hormozganensis]
MSEPIKTRGSKYIKYVLENQSYKRFDATAIRQCELLDAQARTPKAADRTLPLATTAWKVFVPEELTNAGGALHGGAVATLFDMLTSFTISCAEDVEGTGWEVNNVSRTLNCSYLKPIMQGEYMRVECEVTALGKRNGLCRGVMRKWNKEREDGAGGDVCYTCEHGKVNTGIAASKL